MHMLLQVLPQHRLWSSGQVRTAGRCHRRTCNAALCQMQLTAPCYCAFLLSRAIRIETHTGAECIRKPWITEVLIRHPLDSAGSMVAHSSRKAGASDTDSATMWRRATMSCATASRGASSGQGRPTVCERSQIVGAALLANVYGVMACNSTVTALATENLWLSCHGTCVRRSAFILSFSRDA